MLKRPHSAAAHGHGFRKATAPTQRQQRGRAQPALRGRPQGHQVCCSMWQMVSWLLETLPHMRVAQEDKGDMGAETKEFLLASSLCSSAQEAWFCRYTRS